MTRTPPHAKWRAAGIALAVCAAAWPAHAATTAATAAAPPAASLVLAGEELALVGAMSDPTPPCLSCHGAGGRAGNARFPSLDGQPAAYLIQRLHEFQARARVKTPDPLTMTDVAAHLNEAQIEQAAAYFSTLPPTNIHNHPGDIR
jgi:cytochrome c553